MLKTIIVLPDSTEIASGSGTVNAVKSTMLTECVNSGEELALGSACANMFEATLFTPAGGLSLAAGADVTVYKQDESGTRTKIGVFTLEKPTRPAANTMKITGYDSMAKLDKDLTAWLSGLSGWPYSLAVFAGMVCEACGLTFRVMDVPNGDFLVHQFTRTSVTGRQIMRWLGEICCRFCRANSDGEIEFAWYTPENVAVTPSGDLYYFANSLTYEDYQTAAVDAVQIRLADSENGALWPEAAEGANSYIITGNPILNLRITENLEPVLDNIKAELAGFAYTPCKVSVPANLDIHAGSMVQITDKNGITITACVMTKTTAGQKTTLECTGSRRRDSASVVNNPTRSEMAANAAQNAFAGMTQEQIFNKLTDNGKLQGLYTLDGKIYINAEFVEIINLLANSITAGILQSKDGGVKIDLDKGIGNLARGTSAYLSTWDDYMSGWTKDINVVIDEFVSAELEKMQYDTIRDFAARLDSNSLYPEGLKLSLYKFRKSSGQPFASASFEWADGSRSHKTATKDSEESAWQISEMKWWSTD